jgi:hypothetical protein
MLKGLAILALSLLVFPVQAHAHSDKAQQTAESQNPAPSVTPVVPQGADGAELQSKAEKHVHADVWVVQTPKKDGLDYAAFWINFALAIAGFAGIGVGICTLLFLRRQTSEIKRQADFMEGQLKEMQRVSELERATLILQYRPRIIVRSASVKKFSDEVGNVISQPVRCVVAFQIVNTGGAPAHIVDGDIYLLSARLVDPGEEIEFRESTHVGIGPRTLQPGERENIEVALDTRIPNDARWVEFYKGASSHAIFLLGSIWYRDDLEIPRQTGIHRKYDPSNRRFEPKKNDEEEYSD